MIKNIFITGDIGIGKSGVFNKCIPYLTEKGCTIDGLITRPIKNGMEKIGFEIQNFKGLNQIFAHKEFRSHVRFAQYRIDLSIFNEFGVKTLKESLKSSAVIAIDEIGIMEKDALEYREQLIECMNSEKLFFAVFQKRATWFSKFVECRNDSFILELTLKNRNDVNVLLSRKLAAYCKNIKFYLDN